MFDSVPHKRLLLKLQLFGIGGSLLQELFDYTHRQRVVLILQLASSNF